MKTRAEILRRLDDAPSAAAAEELRKELEAVDALPFPKHEAELCLTHNPHKCYYETVEQLLKGEGWSMDFESAEHRNRCLATNELWVLRWYPHTPIGFHTIGAPTLAEVLSFAKTYDE